MIQTELFRFTPGSISSSNEHVVQYISCFSHTMCRLKRTEAFFFWGGGFSAHFLVEQPGTSLNREPLCIITAETDLKGGFEQKNKYDSCCFRGRTEDEKMQIMSACLDTVFIYKDTEGKMRTKKNTYILCSRADCYTCKSIPLKLQNDLSSLKTEALLTPVCNLYCD